MITFNQNRDEIVNFDNIINIMITDCDGDFVLTAIALVGVDDVYKELGYYKTEEILKDIVSKYRQFNFDKNQAVTILPKVYEMPKE